MRFDNDVYDKLFPRTKTVEKVETVVDSFRPTEEEQGVKKEDDTIVEPIEETGDDNGQHDSVDTEQ